MVVGHAMCAAATRRVVAITPIARRALLSSHDVYGGLQHATELVVKSVLENRMLYSHAAKGSVLETYLLEQIDKYGFRAKAVAADGPPVSIDFPGVRTVFFPGSRLPSAASFNVTQATLFRPLQHNYPDVDCLLWEPRQAVLIPIQVTVGDVVAHISRCRFNDRSSAPSPAWQWLKFCSDAMRAAGLSACPRLPSGESLAAEDDGKAVANKSSRLQKKIKKTTDEQLEEKQKPARGTGVIWIAPSTAAVADSNQCRLELCVDFAELSKEPHFGLFNTAISILARVTSPN
jgi:hypothetical protein